MHRIELRERIIVVERKLISHADCLKWRRPNERAAERPEGFKTFRLSEVRSESKSMGVPSAQKNCACLTSSL